MSEQTASKRGFDYWEGILLLVGFIIVSLTFAGFVALVSTFNDNVVALPMLAIAGIILILICLAAIAYVFARMGSGDGTQALGLPPGSIQAVIALSLVVLFAILSIFLFSSMKGQPPRALSGISAADRDKMGRLASGFAGFKADVDAKGAATGTFTIYVRDPRDPELDARNDIAKQLLILIGTLMTSAVGFYFGSKATAAGAAAATGNAARTGISRRPRTTRRTIAAVEPAEWRSQRPDRQRENHRHRSRGRDRGLPARCGHAAGRLGQRHRHRNHLYRDAQPPTRQPEPTTPRSPEMGRRSSNRRH